jgi:hypothetical protein
MSKGMNPLIGLGFAALGIGYLWEFVRKDETGGVAPAVPPFELQGSPRPSLSGERYQAFLANIERKPGSRAVGSLAQHDPFTADGRHAIDLGKATPQYDMRDPKSKGVREVKFHTVSTIDERVGHIIKQIREDSLEPMVITQAREIVSGRCPVVKGGARGVEWCIKPKDHKGEIEAIYHAITDPNSKYAMRYVRDHAGVDLFANNKLLSRLPAGDCDDMAIRGGALLRAIGFDVKCRVVAPRNAPEQWAHIYLMIGNPPGENKQWFAFDASEVGRGRPFNWEVPKHLISTVRDFPV